MKIPIKKYAKKAFVYISDKTSPKEFYIVKSGKIKISRTAPIIGELDEVKSVGYIFGIIPCFTGVPEDVNVVTLTECEIMVVEKEKMEELFVDHKKIVMKILSEYSEILRRLDSDLINFNFYPTDTDRKEKAFEIADKYLALGQKIKAAHLVNAIISEFPDDKDIVKRALKMIPDMKIEPVIYIDDILYEQKFMKGSVIFTEFEKANNFYLIKKGKVKITKLKHDKEILLAILGDSDIFGEMAVLNDKPRNASAYAVEETTVMVIDKKGIEKLPPPIILKLMEFLSKRIWLVQQQLICYKMPSVTAKLYYFLTSKIKQVIRELEEEKNDSFIFKFPSEELYRMVDFDYTERKQDEISDFLNDKNIELYWDSIKIRNIGELFDKNSYHFARAMIAYNTRKKDI